ncbi:DUF2634 domain-containing protein [Cohnella nanjingensis]|uniref:DUF2634 domain-containing protein n=1 Tax=Cohnella nanjingensis TaxID=1387779 RepID=A0A7X0RMJ7_9BACL|nr:DUF2634 domain-containing protein [Cohnella nanjingensis]MBB6670287.1 DUF2634 domain-containing protein [Cohnella nanjingensis]
MIPSGGIELDMPVEEVQQPSRTYRLDLESNRIVGKVDGLEALRQFVFKTLSTERFEHLIYSNDYGMEGSQLLGTSPLLFRSEIPRRIREALIVDDRVQTVERFETTVDGDSALVRFVVVSVYGAFQEEVRINNV